MAGTLKVRAGTVHDARPPRRSAFTRLAAAIKPARRPLLNARKRHILAARQRRTTPYDPSRWWKYVQMVTEGVSLSVYERTSS